MNWNLSKFLPLFFSIFIISLGSRAQTINNNNSIGLNVGPNIGFTDVKEGKFGFSALVSLDRYITPRIITGIEGQIGEIKGGDMRTDPHNREFVNRYASGTVNIKYVFLELFAPNNCFEKYNIGGLYIGAGAGIIYNNMVKIVREVEYLENNQIYKYRYPGHNGSINLVFPFNFGALINLYNKNGKANFALNLNLQSNLVLGDNLDGYNDPSNQMKNKNEDMYNTYTAGIRYYF